LGACRLAETRPAGVGEVDGVAKGACRDTRRLHAEVQFRSVTELSKYRIEGIVPFRPLNESRCAAACTHRAPL